jgi:hypothetical protein
LAYALKLIESLLNLASGKVAGPNFRGITVVLIQDALRGRNDPMGILRWEAMQGGRAIHSCINGSLVGNHARWIEVA